jgi:predicted O-methyltransferase YrrM
MNIVDKLLESTDYIRLKTITETMKGNTFHHHYYILYPLRTLLGSEKKTYTEIGTFHGGSLSFMLEHPFDTEYHCIDPCMYPNQYENIHENIKLFNVNNRIVKHHKEFSTNQTFINQLISSKFNTDILFIDGDHSFNAVVYDFLHFSQFVNSGGFIVFDDYNDLEFSPEVKIAVDTLQQKGFFKDYQVIGDFENIHKVYPSNLSRINEFIIKKI